MNEDISENFVDGTLQPLHPLLDYMRGLSKTFEEAYKGYIFNNSFHAHGTSKQFAFECEILVAMARSWAEDTFNIDIPLEVTTEAQTVSFFENTPVVKLGRL